MRSRSTWAASSPGTSSSSACGAGGHRIATARSTSSSASSARRSTPAPRATPSSRRATASATSWRRSPSESWGEPERPARGGEHPVYLASRMISEATLSSLELAEELRPALLRLARNLRRETEALGVTSHQVTLLWLVKDRPGLSLRELAEEEGISAPSLSGHVDRLESAGLLRRVRSSDDRRRVGLELTPEGRAILKRVRARRTTWLAERLALLSDDERERIERALPALYAILEPGP